MNELLKNAAADLLDVAFEYETIVGEVGVYYSVSFVKISGVEYFDVTRVFRAGDEIETESAMGSWMNKMTVENIEIAISKIKRFKK